MLSQRVPALGYRAAISAITTVMQPRTVKSLPPFPPIGPALSEFRRGNFEAKLVYAAREVAREHLGCDWESAFVALTRLASLRTDGIRPYFEPALADRLGGVLAHYALAELHLEVFYEWLRAPLSDQKEAVAGYLRGSEVATLDKTWVFRSMRFIPNSAPPGAPTICRRPESRHPHAQGRACRPRGSSK